MTVKKKREWKDNFLKKYFFDNDSTLLLPFFFFTLFLIVILQQCPSFSIKQSFFDGGFEGLTSLATGIYAFLILSVIAALYGVSKKIVKKGIEPESLDKVNSFVIGKGYDSKKLIPRTIQSIDLKDFLQDTANQNKYGFIVGKSGSGKSTLLKEYIKNNYKEFIVTENHKEYGNHSNRQYVKRFEALDYIKSDGLDRELTKIREKKNIERYFVIFDQFERTLENENIFDCIYNFLEELKRTKNVIVSPFFVSTKHHYVDAIQKLQKLNDYNNDYTNNNINNFLVQVKSKEKVEMLNDLEEGLPNKTKNDKRKKFFDELLSFDNNVSMIEMNIARIYFKKPSVYNEDGSSDYMGVLSKEDPIELILEKYFNKIFAGIEDSHYAMVIIYAICCSDYSNTLNIDDFKNLTFAPQKTIEDILGILEKYKIIERPSNSDDEGDKNEKDPYIMMHDYLIAYLEGYCSGRLFEQVTTNIRFYCKEKKKRIKRVIKGKKGKAINEAKAEIQKNILSPYYKNTVAQKSCNKFLERCLITLCIIMTSICVWYEIIGYESGLFSFFNIEINHNILALNVLASGSAIFYVYHYLYYFAKIFYSIRSKGHRREFFLTCALTIVGMFLICLSLLIYELSVVFIALGWLIVAFLHLGLSKKSIPNENARVRLKREGSLYILITFILILLNFVVILFGGITEFHYIMFFVLVVLIIRQQIHKDFMLAKLGVFASLRKE